MRYVKSSVCTLNTADIQPLVCCYDCRRIISAWRTDRYLPGLSGFLTAGKGGRWTLMWPNEAIGLSEVIAKASPPMDVIVAVLSCPPGLCFLQKAVRQARRSGGGQVVRNCGMAWNATAKSKRVASGRFSIYNKSVRRRSQRRRPPRAVQWKLSARFLCNVGYLMH